MLFIYLDFHNVCSMQAVFSQQNFWASGANNLGKHMPPFQWDSSSFLIKVINQEHGRCLVNKELYKTT